MDNIFKITSLKFDKKQIVNNYNNEIIDVSNLNIFEAAKAIIMISTYDKCFGRRIKNFRYKVSTPSIKNILRDIPLSCKIELV